jgi:hypothetical protein
MGREVRRVHPDWVHPRDKNGRHIPLFEGDAYKEKLDGWIEMASREGEKVADEWFGSKPDPSDYMPKWTAEEATYYMMYEDTTEGTPISPAFATIEELARWLSDNGASAFGYMTASYEAWLNTCKVGWAPGLIGIEAGGRVQLYSGVEIIKNQEDR